MKLSYPILLVLKVHHILQKIYYPKIFEGKYYGYFEPLFVENFLRNSNFEWTIIRPGGLKENEDIKSENIKYTKEDNQINGSIPRRLVAQCCIDSLKNKESINKIIEVTSSNDNKKISFKKAMQMI